MVVRQFDVSSLCDAYLVYLGDCYECFVQVRQLRGSSRQDNACVHVNYDCPAIIGKGVSVGHGAVVHGSKIGDNCLIGMNAVVLESEIGPNCLIGAGAVVTAGKNIPAGSLVMGVPAKVVRELSEDEINGILRNAHEYVRLAQKFKDESEELA